MKYFKGLPIVLLLAASAMAQYNYPTPEPPRGTYLPPRDTTRAPPPPPPPRPNESQTDISPEGLNPSNPDGEHEPGMPFDFTYAVKDDVGNDFSHKADSDGDVVKGEYRTLLPDGRVQIVRYTADWKNGYNAEVSYEGEAQFPAETPRPFRPESQTNIDSQGIPPPARPTQRPAPPPTQAPYRPPVTQAPYRPPVTQAPYRPPVTQAPYRPPQTQPPPRPIQTQPPRQTYAPETAPPPTQPPAPPGLYGAPSLPFGVRNNPKFGYNQ